MSLSRPPRVLIATAGFGDGHNTAARGLARALEGQAEPLVIDPCEEASPWFQQRSAQWLPLRDHLPAPHLEANLQQRGAP